MPETSPFWQTKDLHALSTEEWESLCDGCGLCCLHKLEDEDDGQVYYTDVACSYLDTQSVKCKDYANRMRNVPGCLQVTPDNVAGLTWWPNTCAYRRVYLRQDLPSWHPLLSGHDEPVPISVSGRCISEDHVSEDELEERIVYWVN